MFEGLKERINNLFRPSEPANPNGPVFTGLPDDRVIYLHKPTSYLERSRQLDKMVKESNAKIRAERSITGENAPRPVPRSTDPDARIGNQGHHVDVYSRSFSRSKYKIDG